MVNNMHGLFIDCALFSQLCCAHMWRTIARGFSLYSFGDLFPCQWCVDGDPQSGEKWLLGSFFNGNV